MATGFLEPVPERFGELGPLSGLMFECTACTRARQYDRLDLVTQWGEQGRVADLVARLRCSNCSAKRRGRALAPLRVTVTKRYRPASEVAYDRLVGIDKLAHDLASLKPMGTVS